ncbi:MAG: hypothetical protein Q4D52_02900 [Eubacteriales bacterium]|nr:hypothetical protein [Eubacteriales bacterium]
MFLKLVKHEFRSSRKVMLIMIAVTLAMCVINFLMPMTFEQMPSTANNVQQGVMISMIMFWVFTYIVVIIGISITAYIFTAIRFYKSMFTHQGYLTHSLPVSRHALIWSKVLVSFFWLTVLGILLGTTVFALIFGVVTQAVPTMVLDMIKSGIGEVLSMFTMEIILFIVSSLMTTLGFILCIYACMALGQRFHNKILASILIFGGFILCYGLINSIGTVMIQQIAAGQINDYILSNNFNPYSARSIGMSLSGGFSFLFSTQSIFGIVMSTIWGGCAYLILSATTKKHLNLD